MTTSLVQGGGERGVIHFVASMAGKPEVFSILCKKNFLPAFPS